MRTERDLNKVLKTLDNQEKLVFVLEDWDKGVQVDTNATFETIKQALAAAKLKYGDRFSFRAFNPNVDVWWNGEVGIICDEPAPEDSTRLVLEFDLKRHPAMIEFAKVLSPDDPKKNLRPFRIKALLLRDGRGVFWRFFELIQEGG